MTEVDYNGVSHDLTTYDSSGRANMSSMADGSQKVSIVYGANGTGPTASVINALGHTNVYQYDGGDNLVSITGDASQQCIGSFSKNTYDTQGNLSSSTDNSGNITDYAYAASGLLQQKVEAVGTPSQRTTNYIWDNTPGTDRLLSVTVAGLSETTYTYNAQGRLASTNVVNLSATGTANQALTTTYNYALYGNGMVQTQSVTHPSPGGTDKDTYTYDALGNLASVSDGLGHTTTYSNYTALGLPGQVSGPNGDVTNYNYDARGRVASIVRHPNDVAATWSYAYDVFGLPTGMTAPDNSVSSITRNAYMQITSATHNDKDGTSTESFAYDTNGDVITHTVARGSDIGVEESATYDELGRLIQKQGMHGQSLTYTYDVDDDVLSTTDALSHAVTYQYDALNRVTQSTDPNGGVTKYAYDLGDHVIKVTDPRGLITTYAYDGLGQLWSKSSPDTGTTTFTYDAYGRRASMKRADGVQTTYAYDTLNRPTSVSAGGLMQSSTYDSCTHGLGRPCSVSDATGTTSYSYTPEGWVTGRSFSIGGTTYALGYGYDSVGHVASVTYPDGNSATYNYTNGVVSGVTLAVSGTSTSAASAVTYRPGNAAMVSWTSSNGLVNTLAYDSDGRLGSISVPGVQSLGFTYDAANRITGITNGLNSSLTQTIGYDALSRMTSVSSGADNENYLYDADGNRLTGVVNGAAQTYAYGSGGNQLTSFSSSLSTQYGYDTKGNTTLVNGVTSYQYDPFNRLNNAGGATNYVNPEGQRLRKSGGSTGTTYFAPDASGALMAEFNGTWVDYVRLNGRLIGRIGGGQIYVIHDDQVGRPEAVTDASRTVVWRAQNYPFTQNVTLANITLNLGFPGQYYDAETWTWNNGYRDYNSGFGRYLESDPIGLAAGVNTYAYVGDNPISGIDPLGLCDQQKCTAARAFLASLGDQLSSAGSIATWTGVGVIAASGVAGLLAPEAAPAEIEGGIEGAGLIKVGSFASMAGKTLTGYAQGGFQSAGLALVRSVVTDQGGEFVLGHMFKDAGESTIAAANSILGQIPDALTAEEAACANQ